MIDRFNFLEIDNVHALARFDTVNPVTITVYNALDTSTPLTLDDNVCTKVGSELTYKWSFSKLTVKPTVFTQFLYVMTDGIDTQTETYIFDNEIIRNALEDTATTSAFTRMTTGDTVTIRIYNLLTDLLVPLNDNTMPEVGTTGFFEWSFSNVTTLPANPDQVTEYLYIADNGVDVNMEVARFGGLITTAVSDEIIPGEMCKVTANFYEPQDDSIETNKLNSDVNKTYAEIIGTFYQTSSEKYFTNEQVKPSYSKETGKAFWILPQGATVKFFVKQISMDSTTTIPALSTTTLNSIT